MGVRISFLYSFILAFIMNVTYATSVVNINLGFGYENIAVLEKSQNENFFTRVSLAKNFLELKNNKGSRLNFGVEIAACSGFFGPLKISDEDQDVIGGGTPIVLSSPRIEILANTRKYINDSKVFALAKLGIDVSSIKFARYDFNQSASMNFIGYAGYGFEINKKSEINITISSSRPLSILGLPQPNLDSMPNPYTQLAALISFGYIL